MTIILNGPPSGGNHIPSLYPDRPMTSCPDKTQLTREVEKIPDWAYVLGYDQDGKPVFFVWTCARCDWYIDDFQSDIWPIRCSDCNKKFMQWKRTRTWTKKFETWFDQDKHKFVKLLTLTVNLHEILPGIDIESQKQELVKRARTKLTAAFKKMRRTAAWKNHVDGGLWFFEWTEESTIAGDIVWTEFNPHLHVILLSKYFPQKEIKELAMHYDLGEIVDIRADKTKTAEDSLAYISHYSKKQYQSEGRNRNAFGCMMRRKKQ